MTLPLIRAIDGGRSARTRCCIRGAVTGGRITEFGPVMDVLVRTTALEYTRERAAREAAAAVGARGDASRFRRIGKLC